MSEPDLRPFDFTARKIPAPLMEHVSRWEQKYQFLVDGLLYDLTACETTTQSKIPSLKTFGDVQASWKSPTIGLMISVNEFSLPLAIVARRDQILQHGLTILGQESTELPERDLTSAELSMAQLILEQIASAYASTWPQQESLDISFLGVDRNMAQSRAFRPDSDIVMLESTTKHPGGELTTSLLFPRSGMEQVLDLEPVEVEEGTDRETLSLDSMQDVGLTLVVALSSTAFMSDLTSLAVGDVITFDQRIDTPMPVTANGKPIFLGWPGKVASQQGIKLDSVA